MGIEAFAERISVSEQSSIRYAGSSVLYFDPFRIPDPGAKHDADLIFLTHDHFDHFSPADIRKVSSPDTVFLMPLTMVQAKAQLGLDEDHVILMRPGEKRVLFDTEIVAVPAYNPAKPFHPKANGWLGYAVSIDGITLYVTGDSDDTPEAAEQKPDVLFVPIGGTYTTDPEQAAELTKKISPKAVVPTHYGTVVGTKDMISRFRDALGEEIPVWEKLKF